MPTTFRQYKHNFSLDMAWVPGFGVGFETGFDMDADMALTPISVGPSDAGLSDAGFSQAGFSQAEPVSTPPAAQAVPRPGLETDVSACPKFIHASADTRAYVLPSVKLVRGALQRVMAEASRGPAGDALGLALAELVPPSELAVGMLVWICSFMLTDGALMAPPVTFNELRALAVSVAVAARALKESDMRPIFGGDPLYMALAAALTAFPAEFRPECLALMAGI